MNYLLNKYLPQIEFSSYEEFKEKLKINVPEDFNFGYDVVDAWAKEYILYSNIERLAPKVIEKTRKMYKGVSANIDFYSGFVYNMLGLPLELYTPIFAMARISGWSAHRLEEIINANKIIRPAYKCVQTRREYKPLSDR